VRVVTLVGNRPQFVKAAAVSGPLRRRHEEVLVHSGQHYDEELSGVFFRELGLPKPNHQLGVGSGSDAEQVARIMHAFEPVLEEGRPDAGLVYGDTNTTLAGALSCARHQIPLVHVEAGMRSFDFEMPEERNRVLTDHLSQLLLCSTEVAVSNLRNEGVLGAVALVGDVMADVSLAMGASADAAGVVERFDLAPGRYLVVTAHRAGNVDDPQRLAGLVEILDRLPLPAVFPVHPRTHARLAGAGLLDRLEDHDSLLLTEPLGYLDFLGLLRAAAAVLTDSGGVQKEAYLAGVPCLTMRAETEWPETVDNGWNRLVGMDPERVLAALRDLDSPAERPELYGGGGAGEAIVTALEAWADGSLSYTETG
jgi:UDP-N-acetylglucosamine 2-epimerase (non-hydrolysing)/UDP-GlcNAc3NAcA epimerase